MITADAQKRAAALEAVKLVEDGMHLGLGTGSTSGHFIEAIARRISNENLKIIGAATSQATEHHATSLGIPMQPLRGLLDLAVDGADQIEFGTLNLVKGLGGALLREKQVAESARRFIVIADESKLVSRLGAQTKLPVEIVAFGIERTLARLAELGMAPELRMAAPGQPYRTDNGNLIAHCTINENFETSALERAIKTIAGVVETGLFIGHCASAILGFADGSTRAFLGNQLAASGLSPLIATLRQLNLPRPRVRPVIAVMGVAASGKSTIGSLLAAGLDLPFIDGDDLHPPGNRAKMRAGHPLNDNDRLPWLHRIAGQLGVWRQTGSGGVIVSSLLTRAYRDRVRSDCPDLILVNLVGDRALLAARIAARHGHFMPASLLDSQLATLEPPGADETVMSIDVAASPLQIVASLMRRLAAMA
ncbi:ribose 5-phosphate isomerase A [Acidiphilium sp.]|uniref:ribose 5-phosphate isomerase A n=1 Tax=Acidiphilium sp. TaxID=527 RepID=UPI003D016041